MKITKKVLVIASALMMGSAVFALDGREVMENADNVAKPKFTRAQVQMILIEKNGAKEVRIIDEWGKEEEGSSTIVMQFNSPASVKGTRFSQKTNEGKPDEKYIFLPDVGTVRPVAARQGSQSFMGSQYRISWDDKETWVPVYVEMYNKKGNLCKTLEVKNLKVIKGYPTPLENELTNTETGHKTQLIMSEERLKFDEPINPAYFSKGFLQNGKVSK